MSAKIGSLEKIESLKAQLKKARAKGDQEGARSINLKMLHGKLKLPQEITIKRIIKRGDEGGVFEMHFEIEDGNGKRDRIVTLGKAAVIGSQTRMRTALIDGLDYYLASIKPWKPIGDLILEAKETIATLSENDETRSWIEQMMASAAFFSSTPIDMSNTEQKYDELTDKQLRRHGFIDSEGRAYISLTGMTEYVNVYHLSSKRVSQREIAERLSRLSFASQQVAARHGKDETVSRRFWVSESNFVSVDEFAARKMTSRGPMNERPVSALLH